MHDSLKVIEVMNFIYTMLYKEIGKHIIYKVESINDVYMLSAGVPDPNDNHLRDMAVACLTLSRKLVSSDEPGVQSSFRKENLTTDHSPRGKRCH